MSFRTDILAAVEDARKVPGELDIRQHRVFVVVRTWSGQRVGVGAPTITETELLVSGYPPRVREVSSKDVIASGGLFTSSDLKVGPFTPPHSAGGLNPSVYNPATSAQPTEVFYRVDGPGLTGSSAYFERIEDSSIANFSHYLVLRQTGKRR